MASETWYIITLVSFLTVLSAADPRYENNLTKLWSLSSASKSDGSAVVNVTSASIVIQPTSYGGRVSRKSKDLKVTPDYNYAFKPRTIPVREDEQLQVEKNVYYTQDHNSGMKSDVPFPGNYLAIAKKKGSDNLVRDSTFDNLNVGTFHPRAIPLIMNPEFEGRSLDEDEEPILEKPEGFSEPTASRRSLSYVLGAEDDEEEPDEEEEEEGEEELDELETDDNSQTRHKIKKRLKKKTKKMNKYMMPLLMAYKLKYFALVPVMVAGLILLIGATGLAGFFFALFAAVMGLQKGGY